MPFAIELVDGTPGRVIAETIDDLRAALALNGELATPRASRMPPARKSQYAARPWSAKRKAAKPKTGARATRASRTKKRNGGAGWTPAVYALAESEGITATEARKRIAAEKQAAKLAATKRKPK